MDGQTDNGPRHELAGLRPVELKINGAVIAEGFFDHTTSNCVFARKPHNENRSNKEILLNFSSFISFMDDFTIIYNANAGKKYLNINKSTNE